MRTFFALASALRCLDHPWTAPPGRASTGPDTRPGRASTGPGRRRRVGPRLARDGTEDNITAVDQAQARLETAAMAASTAAGGPVQPRGQ